MLTFARVGIILAVVLSFAALVLLSFEIYGYEQQKEHIARVEAKADAVDKLLGVENRARIDELCFLTEAHGAETTTLDARIRRLEKANDINPPASYPSVLRAPSCQ